MHSFVRLALLFCCFFLFTPEIGYFPRLVIVVPFVALLGILLVADPSWKQSSSAEKASEVSSSSVPTPPPAQPSEGSVDWMANLQAIQNLMGAV